MIPEITLLFTFFASIIILWYRITIKIPELIAVPDEVITARLEEDSAKIRLFFLHFKVFFREKRYKKIFLRMCGKMLHRIHIIIMRLDNTLIALLKKLSENNNKSSNDTAAYEPAEKEKNDRIYWNYLKEREAPQAAFSTENALPQKRIKRKV